MRSQTPRPVRFLAAFAGLALPLTWADSALAATAPTPVVVAAPAATLFAAINSARTATGLTPMASAGDLSAVATEQALAMATQGRLFHNPSLTTEVANWQAVGENVGCGLSASAIAAAFMGSTEHRDNILSTQFTQVGVGAVLYKGLIWVTEDFRLPTAAAARVTSASTASPAKATAPPPAPVLTAHPAPAPVATKPAVIVTTASVTRSAPPTATAAMAPPSSATVSSASQPTETPTTAALTPPAWPTGITNSAPSGRITAATPSGRETPAAPVRHNLFWLSAYRPSSPALPVAATALLLVVMAMVLGRTRRTLAASATAAG